MTACNSTSFEFQLTGKHPTMPASALLQKWVTLGGLCSGEAYDITQPGGQWRDTSHLPAYRLEVSVAKLENCALYIEAALDPDVPASTEGVDSFWTTIVSTTASTLDKTYAVSNCSEQAENKGGGIIRWRIRTEDVAGYKWSACFRVRIYFD